MQLNLQPMRTYLLAILVIILFTLLTDGLLAYFLKRFSITTKNKTFSLIFWLIPALLIITFTFFLFIINKPFVNETWYWYFTLLNGLYILIYVPKALMNFTFILLSLFSHSAKEDRTEGKTFTRTQFLGMIGSIAGLIPFSALLYSISKGRFNYKIHKADVSIKHLPKGLNGLKIVQLSDIHLGNFNSHYHQLDAVVERINALSPDLIFITGDLVNNFATETKGWEKVFSRLQAKIGKYAVLGNHDYGDYSDWKSSAQKKANFDGIKKAYHDFGFKLINNSHITIEKDGSTFSLLGVENWGHPPFPQYGNLQQAMRGADHNFKILLSHDPDHWDAEVLHRSDIDLCLAGHTHGMQMGVKFKNKVWSPAKWKYKHWGGLYKNGEQYLYVNRGLGVIGIPFRIGMPPEITFLRILG